MMLAVATTAEMAVTDEDFQRLLGVIGAATPAQIAALETALQIRREAATTWTTTAPATTAPGPQTDAAKPADGGASIADLEARFAAEPKCPHCQSTKVTKWGSANRLKRYRCKPCDVTFNCLTGTPLAQLHKRELWGGHAQALVDGISLRKVAARLDIHLETAFRWRHRFLKAPKALKPKALEGTVEADETYFLKYEKGSRKLERAPRKRGGKAKKRGLSDEQVPVLIARDRNKTTTDQICISRDSI
jgi:transposase-like protein